MKDTAFWVIAIILALVIIGVGLEAWRYYRGKPPRRE